MSFAFGVNLEYFYPLDREMYGETMADNSWGADIAGIEYSHGTDRNQFYTSNRYDRILSPGLKQSLFWDSGFALDFEERWMWMTWAPNKDVDITHDRLMVPLLITPRYRFFPTASFHPTVAVGAGMYYSGTRILGADFYDQATNPNFNEERSPEESPDATRPDPRTTIRTGRDFSMAGWYPGYHAAVGFDAELQETLSVTLEVRYTSIPSQTFDAVRVREGNLNDWHWEQRDIRGDAGGIAGLLGLSYIFVR